MANGHVRHDALTEMLTYWPGVHVKHELLPTVSTDTQLAQALAFGALAYVPTGQNVHAVDNSDEANVPALQLMHMEAPDSAYVPTGHRKHGLP